MYPDIVWFLIDFCKGSIRFFQPRENERPKSIKGLNVGMT